MLILDKFFLKYQKLIILAKSEGQNLKDVHITYPFLGLLIFFWLTLVDIYCLEFFSHHTKEILYMNTNFMGKQSWNKNKHFHLFLIDVEKTYFLM